MLSGHVATRRRSNYRTQLWIVAPGSSYDVKRRVGKLSQAAGHSQQKFASAMLRQRQKNKNEKSR
jgi:hypothetical protein